MVLVDSSIWVRAGANLELLSAFTDDDEIAVSPPIVNEILRGSKDAARFQRAREMFLRLTLLDAPMPLERFERAAQMYMTCRAEGITIRNAFDCLIATTAIEHDVPLLHDDSDFDRIARVTSLKSIRVR